ncbi:MAG: right-handed parallel beta-helix repeat-containing protein [Actinobacteria bacterium]|nr:right-handed parallel beta-helix repeat-containing protein [Actinomycetota bacterium]
MSGSRFLGFSASLVFALLAVLILALMSGGGPAAASAAYTAYSHQITINSTGDECSSVGTWDQSSQSCTLNTDITDTTVWIVSSGVTLNGNSHLVNWGSDVHFGVIIGDYTSGVTVENLSASGFLGSDSPTTSNQNIHWAGADSAIFEKSTSSTNTFTNDSAINSDAGFFLWGPNNTLSGNNVSNNGINCTKGSCGGIQLLGDGNTVSGNTVDSDAGPYGGIIVQSSGNTISGNTVDSNTSGISLYGNNNAAENNTANNNGGRGIFATGSGDTISGNTASSNGWAGISSVGDSLNNSTISGNTVHDNGQNGSGNSGISLYGSSGDTISNNDTSYNGGMGPNGLYSEWELPGIYLASVSDSTISGNVSNSNGYSGMGGGDGIFLQANSAFGNGSCASDIIKNNTFDSNTLIYGSGIHVYGCSYLTIAGNTIGSNYLGLNLGNNTYNSQVYHNNFIDNATQANGSTSSDVFSLPAPVGGNYWSDFSPGCNDADHDGFCDSPDYNYSAGAGNPEDDLPLTQPVASGKPPLTLDLPSPSWASLSDYQAGVLSVTWTVNNTGANEAWSVQLTGSTNTGGVTLASTLPATVGTGDILPGSSGSVTLRYNVPAGVGSWVSTLSGSAQDGVGTTYTYP